MIFAVFDPSPLTVCTNCSFFTYIFAVLLPDLSRQYCHSVHSESFWKWTRDIIRVNQSKSATTGADFRNGMVKRVKLRQRAKFLATGSTIAEIWRYFDFSRWRPPPSWIFKFLKFLTVRRLKRAELSVPPCQIWSKSVKTRPRYGDISIFQDVGHPPSWLCCACVQTTHEGYLVVFIAVQNLVGIGAVVLIICTFFDFASLAWKRLFTPPKIWVLGEFCPLNGEQCQRNPKKAHPCASLRRLSHHARKSVDESVGEFTKKRV